MTGHIPSDPILCPSEPSWRVLLADLAERGWYPSRVSRAILAPPTTVQHWLEGGTPTYPYGQALLKLHQWVCGPELTKNRNDEATARGISDSVPEADSLSNGKPDRNGC